MSSNRIKGGGAALFAWIAVFRGPLVLGSFGLIAPSFRAAKIDGRRPPLGTLSLNPYGGGFLNRATILAALLQRKNTTWRFLTPHGSTFAPEGETRELNPETIMAFLASHPGSCLRGEGGGRYIEVSMDGDEFKLQENTLAGLAGGYALHEQNTRGGIERKLLRKFVQTRRIPGEITENRRRESQLATFLARLLATIETSARPVLLECGCGSVPLGLAVLALLARNGRPGRMIGLDSSAGAVAAAEQLALDLNLAGASGFLARSIGKYQASFVPDLLLAVHTCENATAEAINLGLTSGARVIVLAPCCAPPGSAQANGLAVQSEVSSPILWQRLDCLGLILGSLSRLEHAGYRTEIFEVYLRPWRTMEIGIAAYLPSAGGKE